MGAYLQEGQTFAFRIRNAARLASRSPLARRGVDFLRMLALKQSRASIFCVAACAIFRLRFRWSRGRCAAA